MLHVVALSGKMGCGKSTLAHILCRHFLNKRMMALVYSFGSAVKKESSEAFGFPLIDATSQEGKLKKIDYNPHWEDVLSCPPEWRDRGYALVRELLQAYGYHMRQVSPGHWVDKLADELAEDRFLSERMNLPIYRIIDDMRHFDELEMVKEYDAFCVRIEPYPTWKPGPHADHYSEIALDDVPSDRWDHIVRVDYGCLQDAADAILKHMREKRNDR